MRYLSICSGIEAATTAWHPLGWTAVAFAEIDKFPSAVLSAHYPNTPNLCDFTKIQAADVGAIDILVGGTPCQSFSIAGLRGGLADDRGNLALEFLKLAQRTRPRWLVWENVPGVLSSNGGRDFGAILGGMVECGYGFAYRVLDAQYFGLAQRRRRVFVVGYLGDWRRAAAVLFERESLSGHPAPRRQSRKDVTGTLGSRTSASGGLGTDFDLDAGLVAATLNAHGGCGRLDGGSETFVTHSLRGEGHDASEDGTGRGVPLVAFDCKAGANTGFAVGDIPGALRGEGNGGGHAAISSTNDVRRLTPRECERLMGFPDDYTAITYRGKPAADGPRYKALGNSMAVPVMAWIGRRIQSVKTWKENCTCKRMSK